MKLLKIGVWADNAYIKAYPEGQKMLQLAIDNAVTVDEHGNVSGMGDMTKLTIPEIERLWHEHGIYNEEGNELSFDIDDEDYEHFGNPLDALVHPATVVILANNWQKNHDEGALRQMKAELQEVIHHMENVREMLETDQAIAMVEE